MSSKKENPIMRHSGVELLRILAACFVMAGHYCNPKMSGFILEPGGGRFYLINAIIAVCCCAVNCFILITGYYSYNSKPYRSLGKPFYLYIQVVIFHFLTYATLLLTGESCFEINTIIALFLPTNYFVTVFITLYLVSPLINRLLHAMSKKTFYRTIIMLLFLFSLYPSLMDIIREISGNDLLGTSTIGLWGSQYGYTIVNFTLLYIIGAYLKRFDIIESFNSTKWFICAFLCAGVIFIWRIISLHFHDMGESSAFSYLNPFVIMLSVCLFGLFSKMKFKSKIINELAGAAFTCFLFHQSALHYLNISEHASDSTSQFLAHFIISIVFLYLLSYFVYKLLDFFLGPLIRKLNRYLLSYEEETPFIIKKD